MDILPFQNNKILPKPSFKPFLLNLANLGVGVDNIFTLLNYLFRNVISFLENSVDPYELASPFHVFLGESNSIHTDNDRFGPAWV